MLERSVPPHRLPAALVTLAVLATSLFAQGPGNNDRHLRWLNEEVVYLITAQERREFEDCRTAVARDAFIERFWLRRDNRPETSKNEFRIEHYKRLEYATAEFGSNTKPGWATDRGRIWILYGPPDEREIHPAWVPGSPTSGFADAYPFELWDYRNFGGRGETVLEFVDATLTGEYHMTTPLPKQP